MEITVESLKQAYPDIHAAILKEGHDTGFAAGLKQGKEEGFKAGAEQERTRVQGVEEIIVKAHLRSDERLEKAKWDGKTTPAQAAMLAIDIGDEQRQTSAAAFKTDAPPVVPAADAAKVEPKQVEKTDGPKTEEQMKAAWESDPKLRAEFMDDFDAYKAYLEAEAHGQIKIYKGGK